MPQLRIIDGGRGLDIPAPPLIRPYPEGGPIRTGTLFSMTPDDITRILGFPPNITDTEWAFTVDGVRCSVWSDRGSHERGTWATWGAADAMRRVFGRRWMV